MSYSIVQRFEHFYVIALYKLNIIIINYFQHQNRLIYAAL